MYLINHFDAYCITLVHHFLNALLKLIANSVDLHWHWTRVALNYTSATLGWISINLFQCDTVVIQGSHCDRTE